MSVHVTGRVGLIAKHLVLHVLNGMYERCHNIYELGCAGSFDRFAFTRGARELALIGDSFARRLSRVVVNFIAAFSGKLRVDRLDQKPAPFSADLITSDFFLRLRLCTSASGLPFC